MSRITSFDFIALLIVFISLFMLLQLQLRLWHGDEGSLPHIWQLEDQIASQEQHNNQLLLQNKTLALEIYALKNDTLDAIEEYARSELGLIKPGEEFYVLRSPPSDQSLSPRTPPATQLKPSPIQP